MPDRTILKWEPVLPRDQPRGELDLTWRWKAVVGRAKECDVPLKHPSIPLRHGCFARLQNVWFVENYDTAHGIYVRGKRVMLEAVHGNDVDFAMLVRFRLQTVPMPAEEAAFREAIRAGPNDDGRYLVYADWLLEQGEPLGQWMVSPILPEAPLLGPLKSPGIAITFRHGFFDTVKVRTSSATFSKAGIFAEVLTHPLAAFLQTLEVDAVLLQQESPAIAAENWVDWLFEALLPSAPATLRHLKVRLPLHKGARFENELKALKRKAPQLQTPFDRLFTEGALT